MSVDFIGMIQSQKQSEIPPPDPNGTAITCVP